jgi:hypothetical protein
MTAHDTMTAKKEQAEKLLAQKIALRNSTAESIKPFEAVTGDEADNFGVSFLKADIERLDLEIEALQAFIEGIELELTKRQ